MAELSLSRGGRGDRGQLILVTGFALAFVLVALVLLLNTTIYTENIASRGIDRSPDEAVEFRVAVQDGVRDLMIAENGEPNGFTESNFSDSLTNLSWMMERGYEDRGTIAVVNNSSFTTRDGTILRQTNQTRELINATGPVGNWTLATSVNRVRRVRFNLSKSDLRGTFSGSFQVNFTDTNDDGNYWRVYIHEYNDGIRIWTKADGENRTRQCSIEVAEDANATIDITEGTVAGEPCRGLRWWGGEQPSDFDITFENPGEATGSYSMVIDNGNPKTSNFNDQPEVVLKAAYSTTLRVRYQTSTLTYETNITVAPGEPDNV